MRHPKITLIAIDTAFHALTSLAIAQTEAIVEPTDVLVLTDQTEHYPNWRCVKIPKFTDKEEYNKIALEVANHPSSSDYYLFIQYDGFALDKSRWMDSFLDYDYIGAPWPNYPYHLVGNGGFSLRSRRLVEAVASYAHLRLAGQPEDVFIGRTIRPLLESNHGIRFPLPEDALKFSFESPGHPKTAFGFHGVLNLAIAYQNAPDAFFAAAPESLYVDRVRELSFGLAFIEEKKRNAFKSEWKNKFAKANA